MSKKIEKKNLAKTVKSKQASKKLRLPNGKTTANIGLYAAEWKSVAESLEMFLPDWKVVSVDPDVTYSTLDGNITLPLWAVNQIAKAISNNAKQENEFVVKAVEGFLGTLKW
jgi:hypothetical protein